MTTRPKTLLKHSVRLEIPSSVWFITLLNLEITITIKKQPAPVSTIIKVIYLTKITVTSKGGDLSPFISQLLDILTKKNVLPKETTRDIISTFSKLMKRLKNLVKRLNLDKI